MFGKVYITFEVVGNRSLSDVFSFKCIFMILVVNPGVKTQGSKHANQLAYAGPGDHFVSVWVTICVNKFK